MRKGAARVESESRRPLARYRVVELAGPATLQCGKALADLGADVIKLEPPGGDPARTLPPLAPDGSTGLYWLAYSQGKRSAVADLETAAGRGTLEQLAACSDVVVESFPPGYLDALDLGYERLRAINPGLVLTSVTPFGQTGPYAERRGSDLVHLAMGGYLYMTGPPDGAPIKPSAPFQTYLHASMQAVAATLLALRQRRRTGLGTHVDQAMRDTGVWMLTHTYQFWDLLGVNLKRQGASRDMGGVLRLPSIWRAQDGYVVWLFQTGHIGGQRMYQLVEWMARDGFAPDWMRDVTWESFDLLGAGAEKRDELVHAFSAFFAAKTREELFEWALPRGVMLAPVQTLADVAEDPQLAARGTWRDLQPPAGDAQLQVPGPPVRFSATAWEPCGRVAGVGEDDPAVYGDLLGVDGHVESATRRHAVEEGARR
jgi:crotonobetainyl-CoA:carnitine CoA-transferase CaiB-like acyl-CoA transferase